MIFQNSIVRFIAFFIPVKDIREQFINRASRKTKYRKLRDDLRNVKREIISLRKDLGNINREVKAHIDLRLNSYFNTFFNYDDIKYNNPDLRILQNAKNIMLLELKKICIENDINYWLDFGTLVGAVRHNGFVPWDDDIDLGMMRKDFLKLEKAFEECTQLDIRIMIFKSGTSFAKILKKFDNFNINFDIFLYDYINVHDYDQTISVLNENKIKLINELKDLDPKSTGSISLDFYEQNKEKIDGILGNYLSNCEVRIDDGSHIANLTNLWRSFYLYDKSSLFPLKKMVFEGNEHSVPNNVEEFLRTEFKYYMMLPNDTGKITHGSFFPNDKIKVLEKFVGNHKKD